MAKVGDKVYLQVKEGADGKITVCKDGGVYSNYTNEEIMKLVEIIDGEKVISWTVTEVDERGEITGYRFPVISRARNK